MADFEESQEEVAVLLQGINRYNPENLQQLEAYVQLQTSENTYDLDANLSVLKLMIEQSKRCGNEIVNHFKHYREILYLQMRLSMNDIKNYPDQCQSYQRLRQINIDREGSLGSKPHKDNYVSYSRQLRCYQFTPSLHQTSVVVQTLLKALMNLPRTDFYLCKCLIDENHMQDKSIEKVIYLADLMETCHFKDVWREIRHECPELVEGVKGFEEALQIYISGVLSTTYQSIDVHLLADLLGGLEGDELQEWIKSQGWKLQDDARVFIGNQEHIKSKNIVEKIDFHSVKGMMTCSR